MKSAIELENLLNKVCFDPSVDLPETVEKHFNPHYRQITDGHELNRNDFIKHLQALRLKISEGKITVLDFVFSGNQFADRHRVVARKKDGTLIEVEVYLFAHLDDSKKILKIHEVSCVLQGSAQDQELARVQIE